MTPEQAALRKKVQERMKQIYREKARREGRSKEIPIGFHINGIPIYADDEKEGELW